MVGGLGEGGVEYVLLTNAVVTREEMIRDNPKMVVGMCRGIAKAVISPSTGFAERTDPTQRVSMVHRVNAARCISP